MNLDQLKTFLAVAETGSLRAAGEKCHISQPAVTRQMRLLEETIRTKLLIHYGRGIKLTSAGLKLQKEAIHIFQAIDHSIQKVLLAAGASENEIQLGVSHYAAVYRLPFSIKKFRKKNSVTRLLFSYGTSEEIIKRVEEGGLTFSIGTLPKRSEKLVQVPLWTDVFFAILPHGHPGSSQKEISLQDLAKTDLILPEKGTTTRALIDRAFKSNGISPPSVMEVTYLETIKASVKMGIGTAILPRDMFLQNKSEKNSFAIKPIKGALITRQLGLVFKKGRELFPHEKEFITVLKS